MSSPPLDLPEIVVPEQLRTLVESRPWFHRIDLGHGVVTPGVDDSDFKLTWLHLPERFDGESVLDVGAYDGYYSFEAERRGASRVVAADHYCWNAGPGLGDGRGFDIARWALNSRIEKLDITVEELAPETVGTFDVVLFLGVLYHSQDPLRYLRNVYSVTRRLAVIESHTDGADYDRPMMVFYPGDILNGDPSNYWGPNKQCVMAMLREVGFTRVEPVHEVGMRFVVHAYR